MKNGNFRLIKPQVWQLELVLKSWLVSIQIYGTKYLYSIPLDQGHKRFQASYADRISNLRIFFSLNNTLAK